MAHLVLTIDPDPALRQAFLERASAQLSSYPGLIVEGAQIGRLAVAWGRGASAPHSFCVQKDGLGFVLGHAIDEAGARMDGRAVMERWLEPSPREAVFDGYHLAGAYSQTRGLVVGADPLGLFPLYHAECEGVLIAGTSPELFAAHPRFVAELDVPALAGILLANGLVNGRALLRGVRRLPVGCQLRWTAGQGSREQEVWRLTPHDRFGELSGQSLLELADAEIRRAIRRHKPPQIRTTMMLSGGVDSRLMLGYLHAERAIEHAVCFGRESDFEMRAAAGACRVLDLPLHGERQELNESEFVELSRRVAHWEHLAGGFGGTTVEASGQSVGGHAPAFWSGYAVEDIVGGVASRFGHNAETGEWSFDAFFRTINTWGWPVGVLEELLRVAQSQVLVREAIEALHSEYERPEESPAQRAFRMKLATRTRFYIGSVLHRLCLHTWPLLPVLDRRVLDLHFNAPPQLLLARRLEQRLLVTNFPSLAGVPIDTNSYLFEPLTIRGLGDHSAGRRGLATVRKNLRSWYWRYCRRAEPRRYYRTYDLDSPGWRAVRRAAEPYRKQIGEWLNDGVLRAMLPGPEVKLGLRDPFADRSGRRALLGLMLWSEPR